MRRLVGARFSLSGFLVTVRGGINTVHQHARNFADLADGEPGVIVNGVVKGMNFLYLCIGKICSG